MGGRSQAARFGRTNLGHSHPNTPTIHFGPEPPDPFEVDVRRGDIWIKTKTKGRSEERDR